MKVKRLLSVLLATTLVSGLALTGCGQSEKKNTESGKAQKITIFQSKVEIVDGLEKLAKDYEKETGVQIEVWGTTGDDYIQQLKTKLSNNQGPTIMSLNHGAEVQQLKSYLYDLSDQEIVKNIAENMSYTIDDKVYGIPYTVEGFGIVYNKNLIDASNVNDYETFVNMLKEQKANGINGFSLSQESYFLIGHMLNTPFALQENPKEFIEKLAAGEVKMADTAEFQEYGKFMEAIKEYTPNPLEINYDKECGDFATGKNASIHQGNWSYSMFTDYDVDFEMGIMPLPINGNDKLSVSVPIDWCVNATADQAEINAGLEFLNWLHTSETGKKYLTEEFGFIPAMTNIENTNLDPLSEAVSEYTASGETITWAMNDWPAGIVDVYLVPVAEKFFTTDMSGQEFIEALDAAWAEATK